jgi:predicted secreted hydrolase
VPGDGRRQGVSPRGYAAPAHGFAGDGRQRGAFTRIDLLTPRGRRLSALLAGAVALAFVCTTAAGARSQQWEPAGPGYRFTFPRDYGAHERSRNEWWYYTGNVRDAHGRRFGFEETIFRYGVQHAIPGGSRWDIDDLYFAHFAITDVGGRRFVSFDRTGRAALGGAGASSGDERAWVGDWRVERSSAAGAHELSAAGEGGAALRMRLVPDGPPTINGRDGVSRKGACASCASHYYSLMRLRASGSVTVGAASFAVDGTAWNDHEWGSDELESGVAGWDWFSMQLDDGTDVMLYRLRLRDGATVPQSSGTFVRTGRAPVVLNVADFRIAPTGTWTSPRDGAAYPSGWRVTLPRQRADLTVVPLLEDQELNTERSTHVSYWEGACEIRGTLAGRQVHGYGYTELTGYAPGGLGGLR